MLFSSTSAVALVALIDVSLASYLANHNVQVVKSVMLSNGQVIDWIHRDAQGEVAAPPALPPSGNFTELDLNVFEPHQLGPDGTVPIVRSESLSLAMKQSPQSQSSRIQKRQNKGKHWYSSTQQRVNNHGSHALLSMFKAYVQSNGGFSLLQTAVERNNVPGIGLQTVEAGWINYPNQRAKPHLFAFFNTNNYEGYSDYRCGWNTDVKGWVQADKTYFPGMELTQLSTVGSTQYDLAIEYKLEKGNYWLGVNGKWIGYYPGSMFTYDGRKSSDTLQGGSDAINWYGEIYQDGEALTTTDMGSGHWAQEGFQKAAYIRAIKYFDTADKEHDYDGSKGILVSDDKRYNIQTHFNSGTTWGSYFYLGAQVLVAALERRQTSLTDVHDGIGPYP